MQRVQGEEEMRIVFILLSVVLLLSSCQKNSGGSASDGVSGGDSFSVAAVDFPSYDAARAVMGGTDDLVMLLPPGTESHSYDPTPRDMVRLSESDLVVYTGGPSDSWVEAILSSLDSPPPSFALTEQVELLEEEHREGMEDDHEAGHSHTIDEHVWTSPRNEMTIIRNLASVMEELDPDNAARYEANAGKYIERIEQLDEAFRDVIDSAPRRTLIFASRFPLLYFVREYGLEYYAAFPGCAEESEPSARTVAFLIDKARELDVPCVLNIEMSSEMIARIIAEEAGCGVRTFNTLHNVSAYDFRRGADYVSLMGENVDVLREALY